MYIPIWLIVIVVVLYFIFKNKQPQIKSTAEAMELIWNEVARREDFILEKIKTSHLKDMLDTEKVFFECGRKNFIRLKERFMHDTIMLNQVVNDWSSYMEIILDMISAVEMHDLSTFDEEYDSDMYYQNLQEFSIKLQEINKRTKELLGEEYVDPQKLI